MDFPSHSRYLFSARVVKNLTKCPAEWENGSYEVVCFYCQYRRILSVSKTLGWEPKRLSDNSAGMWKSKLPNGTLGKSNCSPAYAVRNYLKPCVFIAGLSASLAVPPIPLPLWPNLIVWFCTPLARSLHMLDIERHVFITPHDLKLKMAANRYRTALFAEEVHGLTLLLTHCIGSREL